MISVHALHFETFSYAWYLCDRYHNVYHFMDQKNNKNDFALYVKDIAQLVYAAKI